jgi:aminomethyltransferase
VTSGSVLPTVGGAGGLALVTTTKARIGDQILVDIRGKRKLARLVKKPLYKAKTKG